MITGQEIIAGGIAGIYLLRSHTTNKVYVGQSTDIKRRLFDHQKPSASYNKATHLARAMRKYGPEDFSVAALEVIEDAHALNAAEEYWIQKLTSYKKEVGYNICVIAGRSTYGRKRPEKERRAISEQAKLRVGSKNPFFGKKHTPEAKRKMAAARTGKTLSAAHKKCLHDASLAATKRPVFQISKHTGEVISEWESLSCAARGVGTSTANIHSAINGNRQRKTAGGFTWRYKPD